MIKLNTCLNRHLFPQALFHKYVEDIDFVRSRIAEDEAIREFNRQRDHLEKQVAALKQQLAKSLGGSKSDIGKIMDVSRYKPSL